MKGCNLGRNPTRKTRQEHDSKNSVDLFKPDWKLGGVWVCSYCVESLTGQLVLP